MKIVNRLNETECAVLFNGDDFYDILSHIRKIPSAQFIPNKKYWKLHITKANIEKLADLKFDIHFSILEKLYKSKTKLVANIEHHLKQKLLPFQIEGVNMMQNFNYRVLLADEMGLGKTIETVVFLEANPALRPAIIICPNTLKLNWNKEIKKWMTIKNNTRVITSTDESIPKNKDIYIINYDILNRFIDCKEIKKPGKKTKKVFSKNVLLNAINPNTIIFDECHKIKNKSTIRSQSVKKIVSSCTCIISISGTPIISRPEEIFITLNMLKPDIFNSFFNFANRYCDPKHNGFGWDFTGSSNLEELYEVLKETCMIRRLKKDVLKELPEKRNDIIYIEQTDKKLAEEYLLANDAFLKLIDCKEYVIPNVISQIEHLKQLSFRMKANDLIEWISNFLESGKKLVVFCIHYSAIDLLIDKFKDIVVKIDGRDSIENRDLAVENFQNNNDIKLFVGNINAAGEGITLTAADTCIIAEFPWTPAECNQAVDRLHRIRQKNAVINYFAVCINTVDEYIIDMIETKRQIVDKSLNGHFKEDSILLDLLQEYKKKILKRRK